MNTNTNDEAFEAGENFTNLTDSDWDFLSMEVEEYTVVDKILSGIAWGLLNIPCNAMMFGLVQFDRLGGDPLKRRVTDQVSEGAISFGTSKLFLEFSFILFSALLKHAP